MKNKKRIYDRHELLDLVNKEHSCIILKHCNRKIELQAKYLKDVKSGIKEALDSGLNKFDYSLNGILLDYQNLNVLADEWSGRIVGRFGEFLVTVTADFFVFDPKIGSLLEGVVNVKSSTHVGCLVHKRFNAMILKPDVEDKWNCENIQIGDKIIFTIVDHVFSTNIPHIEGVLATEYIGKSSKNSKKKSKISESQNKDFTENGKFDDLDVLIEANQKISKLDEVDSSIVSVGKQDENDLASILGKKSEKSKSKKRKIDSMGVIDNMDVEESVFQVKKKKKSKSKVKNETTLETEKPLEPISESSIPVENPVSVFSEKVLPTAESEYGQIKPKKKKRVKEKESDNSECNTEHKKKKKKDKRKDSENDVPAPLETVEKKHHESPVVEESVSKSKKKKKREKENSHFDVGKTEEQCELSPSKKNRLCIDDNTEFNVSPVDLIDQLMNVVPTDLMLPSETTPVKGTSLEKLKSPKLGDVRKNETPEKSRSPSKKKREGSFTEITSKSAGTNVENSPTKKRHSRESLKSPKSVKQLDKSLFSDSEGSAQSPLKTLPEPVVVDLGSSQWNLGATGKGEVDEAPITLSQIISKKPKDTNKKEKKPKKVKEPLNPEENQSKKKTVATKGGDSISSIIKSPSSKKDKKDSVNKSVTWETENVPSRGAESKTTLLQRFEKCLDADGLKLMNDFANKSKNTPVKKEVNETEGSPVKKKSNGESPAAKEKSNKKTESDKERNKSEDDLEQSVTQRISYSKIFSAEGVDDTQLNNPVKTSTPKTALNSSDISGGKVKKQRPKKAKKASGGDERASIINALLEQVKESLGISELFQDPSKNTKK